MKKLALIGSVGIIGISLLTGCSEGNIVYEDKERPVADVESIIADQLESENPNMDLEVNITEEADD